MISSFANITKNGFKINFREVYETNYLPFWSAPVRAAILPAAA